MGTAWHDGLVPGGLLTGSLTPTLSLGCVVGPWSGGLHQKASGEFRSSRTLWGYSWLDFNCSWSKKHLFLIKKKKKKEFGGTSVG